jgi:hypothetical protein
VRLPPSWPARLRAALPWLRALVLILTIVALARPQWGVEATTIQREGIAIAMVVDVSSSMGALDLQLGDRQANRLDVVKETFRAFVTRRPRRAGRSRRRPEKARQVAESYQAYVDVFSTIVAAGLALLLLEVLLINTRLRTAP